MSKINDIKLRLRDIINANTSGMTVELSRFSGNPVRKLPTACIYFDNVDRNIDTIGQNRSVFNEAVFAIEIHTDKGALANVSENLDALYDTLLEPLEADRTLNDLAFHAYVSGYSKDISEEGEKPRGVGRIEMAITWYETQSNGGN